MEITIEDSDIYMDEQSSLNVTVIATHPDGSLRDLTGANVVWVAAFNGAQQLKKDIDGMTVMLAPITTTTLADEAIAGQKEVYLNQVAGFGKDPWARPIADFAAGDTITLVNGTAQTEYCTIDTIDSVNMILTMVEDLVYSYNPGDVITKIISSFSFQLLAGDTILPATKTYGTPIIWKHMARATWPSSLSPGNIYQEATAAVVIRGRMFITPILDMD